jgi:hypothetical protein
VISLSQPERQTIARNGSPRRGNKEEPGVHISPCRKRTDPNNERGAGNHGRSPGWLPITPAGRPQSVRSADARRQSRRSGKNAMSSGCTHAANEMAVCGVTGRQTLPQPRFIGYHSRLPQLGDAEADSRRRVAFHCSEIAGETHKRIRATALFVPKNAFTPSGRRVRASLAQSARCAPAMLSMLR